MIESGDWEFVGENTCGSVFYDGKTGQLIEMGGETATLHTPDLTNP